MTTPPKLIELIAEQSDESVSPQSMPEALGLLRIRLHQLESELAKPEDEQDADALFQEFVAISSIAMTTVGALLLPVIERGQQ
jgi:hypothetical protein